MTQTRPPFFYAALWALFATMAFSINDGLIKFLAGDYALHQIVFIRSVSALIIVSLIIVPLSGGFAQARTTRLGAHILRALCLVFANLFFYMALAELQLAEVAGIFFVAPFLVSIFSVIFLGEHVGPQRWFAISLGFIGVLLIVRPGTDAFQVEAILPILAAISYASFHIMTRKLGRTETVVSLTLYPTLVFLGVAGVIGLTLGQGALVLGDSSALTFLTRVWVWPNTWDFGVMIFIGLGIATGGYAISVAYKSAEAALVAPFEYTALIYAAAFGYLFFNEWPDTMSWVGLSIVLASGLFMIWREFVNANAPVAPRAGPR